MKILMSIKPVYWERIKSGEKRIEFRRVIPTCLLPEEFYLRARKPSIVFYASAPTKKVVGEVTISGVCSENLYTWHKICDIAGISYEEFIAYCGGDTSHVWGLYIGEVSVYERPLPLAEIFPSVKRPPQNFCYVREEEYAMGADKTYFASEFERAAHHCDTKEWLEKAVRYNEEYFSKLAGDLYGNL